MLAELTIAALLMSASPPDKLVKPEDDAVMRALVDEVARTKQLHMDEAGAPYYAAAYANDRSSFDVSASFGAIVRRGKSSFTALQPVVRVGTPDLDNTNYLDHERMFGEYYARGGSVPREPDYDALREALWTRFDGAYKRGIEALARKKAYLQTNEAPDRAPDFASAPVVSMILPRAKLSTDEARWTKLVKSASAVFRSAPHLTSGTAHFAASAENQCFASTDPVEDRFGDTRTEIELEAGEQASDGQELSLHWSAIGRSDSDLPKDADVIAAARDLAKKLDALAAAPLLDEDYSGPVLFTNRAAAQFFVSALARPLSSPREMLGSGSEGRLIDRLNKHILPGTITVKDDPTQKTWKGKPLVGWFPIDDDGVKPEPITLVNKGVLSTFFMSRVPTKQVAKTNGHSRAGQGGASNLFVESSEGKTREQLKKQLVQLAKDDDEPYGLLVDSFAESGDDSPFAAMMGMGSGDVRLPNPALVYRVYADGREELVRGATFKPASFQVLKDLVAVGKDVTLQQFLAGQPMSIVAPAVLVKQLDVKKPKRDFEKPPAIARPTL